MRSSHNLAPRSTSSSFLSICKFGTRFLTHLCAPGFAWLMGVGIVHMNTARRKVPPRGVQFAIVIPVSSYVVIRISLKTCKLSMQLLWSTFDIARHATVRAFVLIFPCMMPLEWLSWHLPKYIFPDDKEPANTYVQYVSLYFLSGA